MENSSQQPLSQIKTHRIIYPVAIGLGFVVYKFIKEYNQESFNLISFTWKSVIFIFLAFLLMGFRDLGFILRLRLLTNRQLSWKQAFKVNILWEFGSAILPPFIGGTGVALVFLHKEGLSVGKSSAVVMAVSLLDELFFLLLFPIILILFGTKELFMLGMYNNHAEVPYFAKEFLYFALAGYIIKLVYVLIVGYGLFINPKIIQKLILIIFKLPVLRRWKYGANRAGVDIISSSAELRSKPLWFWLKAFGASSMAWISRFWVANAILLAFFIVPYHLLIFARQLIIWIMMLVIPTPGGSGFNEFAFEKYLGDFIPIEFKYLPVVAISLAFLWRIVSYYPYLIAGTFVFPKWIKDRFNRNKKK